MSHSVSEITPVAEAAATTVINPLEALIGYQVRRASLAINADLSTRMEDLSLTTITLSVIVLIEANPGINQSEIGRRLAIKRANMVPITAHLSERGLIDRVATDRRSHGLSLTAQGQAMVRQAWSRIDANEARFLGGLTTSEIATLASLLARLRGAPNVGRPT